MQTRKKKDLQEPTHVDPQNNASASDECNCQNIPTTFDSDKQITKNEVHTSNNRKEVFENISKGQFNFHAGVLLFAPLLNQLFGKGLGFIYQWLVSVLLGCHNIEQSKILNYTSMEQLIGKTYKTLRTQRTLVRVAATDENTRSVLRFNAQMVGVNKDSDFYYDPHTKHYTGQLKTLSTWCPSVRLADKGINMDYIHTTSGHPVYFNTADNFYDLRERFQANIDGFRSLCGFDSSRTLTFVIDRGIYSLEVFRDIITRDNMHIITWEKDYKSDKWNENDKGKEGVIIRDKNKKGDQKLVRYCYQERTWDKDPNIRQIIVRVYDRDNNVLIELSILTDDKDRDANQIVALMLKRWVQENDFKYMIKHYGLNQITSYAFTDYRALRDKIEDKMYICTQHKKLTKEIQKVRAKLKTALLDKHKYDQKHSDDQKQLPKREQERKKRIENRINNHNTTLKKLEKERSETPKFVSKLEELIEQDYKKLDTNTKSFMDAIKVLARNMFYLTFEPFKEKYNNYRDDHFLFRHLTHSGGLIHADSNGYTIQLQPQMEYQPKVQKIIEEVLQKINDTKPMMPDGSRANIELQNSVKPPLISQTFAKLNI